MAVTVEMDDELVRVVRYDRHDERLSAIIVLGPTRELDLDLRPIEMGQRGNSDIYPQSGYVGYRKRGGD